MNILKYKYRKQHKINPHGPTKYIWQYYKLYSKWKKFLSQFKNERILDFGSGPGFALKAGKELGLNIIGLDIDKEQVYRDINKILDVKPIYYDGIHVPFFEDKFDIIILHWVFIFDFHIENDEFNLMESSNIKIRTEQLKAITKDVGCWYISPKSHYEEAKKYVSNIELIYFIL